MKAVLIARVSTTEQKKAGNSLPAQVDRLKRYCKQNELTIDKVYKIDESAYKTKRDDFDDAMSYIKEKNEKVCVCFDKVDRFSRKVFDKRVSELYEMAVKGKIELHFASDNLSVDENTSASENFQLTVNLSLAKYYSDAISDNVKRANEEKIRKGEWGYPAPIGYLNTKDEDGNKDIDPDPKRARFIKEIFKLYSTGNYSIKQIAKKMEKAGLKSKRNENKSVSKATIHTIIKNPFYHGVMRIKEELHPHKYKPLISKTLFDKCQEVREDYNKKPFDYAAKPFIFRGLIQCAECGCTITPETTKGHIYYSCTNSKGFHNKRNYVREEKLLEPIYNVLKNIQLPDKVIEKVTEELKKTNQSRNDFHKKSLNNLRKDLDKIENRISKLVDKMLDGSITEKMYNKKKKEYEEEKINIKSKMQQYEDANEDFYLTANMVMRLAKNAYEIFKSSEIPKKRKLLNFLIQNAKLEGENLQFELKAPFDTVLNVDGRQEWLRGQDSNL